MVKVTVKHTCGHEATHAISEAEPDRTRRETWLSRQPCQACWRKQQSSAATAQRAQWNLPALEGSEQDTAWAEIIRVKGLAHNRDFRQRLAASKKFSSNDEQLRSAIIAAADQALVELENQRSAAWWIANRFEVLSYVRRRVIAAVSASVHAPAE